MPRSQRIPDIVGTFLFEQAEVAYLLIEPSSRRILKANSSAERLVGLPTDQLIHLTVDDIFQPTASSNPDCPRLCRVQGNAQYAIGPSDSESRRVRLKSQSLGQPGSSVELLVAYPEEHLTSSKQPNCLECMPFRALADCAPVFIWLTDLDKRLIFVNRTLLEFTGWSNEQILGHGWIDLLHPEDQEASVRHYHAHFDAREPFEMRFRFLHESRIYRWMLVRGTPARDLNGRFTGYVGSCTDIEDLLRREQQLRESRSRLQLALEGARNSVWDWNIQTGEVQFSANWTTMLGYEPDEAPTEISAWERLIHPDDLSQVRQLLQAHLQGKTPFYQSEHRLRTRAGDWLWILDRGRVVAFDEKGQPLRATGTHADISERKQAEFRLRLQTKALEAAANAIVITNPRGVIEWANPAFETLTGFTFGEAIGHTHKELIHSFVQPSGFFEAMWGTILAGQVWRGEIINRRKDGSLYTEEQTITPLLDEYGKVTHFIAIKQDITQRKKADAELRQANERFALARRSIGIGVWDWDVVADQMSWDEGMFHLYGITANRFEGKYASWRMRTHPEDLPQVHATVREALSGEKELNTSFRIILPSGEIRFLTASAVVLRDGGGQPLRMVGINLDLTQQYRALEALRESETRFRSLVSALSEGVILQNIDGRILTWNPSAERILLRTGVTLEGWASDDSGWQVVREDGTPLCANDHPSTITLQTGMPQRNVVLGIGGADGERTWLLISTEPLASSPRAKPYAVVTSFVDITERRRIEQEMREARDAAQAANRAKSEFLANMSHEIRTPMNGILGMVGLLLETPLDTEQHDFASTVHSSAQALMTIINDILDFSKIEAGKLELDLHPFALREELTRMLKPLELRARDCGLSLHWQVAEEVPNYLFGDLGRLRQILLNLVGNAIKFTEQGEVTVSLDLVRTGKESESAVVALRGSVRDTGIGIPKKRLEAIFHPFEQADGSTTRKYGGTGLGLSICARLVEMMGGRIWVESEFGQGSTFHFLVRLLRGETPSTPTANDNSTALPCVEQPLQVLVVDDNPINQRLVSSFLKRMGHHSEIAQTGQEAVNLVTQSHFDVVLMDVSMPILDGIQATARIRAQEQQTGAHVHIIALTAHAMKGDRERCLNAGMDGYLTKPIRSDELRQMLAQVPARLPALEKPLDSPRLHCNLERARDYADGDLELLQELIDLFREQGVIQLRQLEDDLEAKKVPDAENTIHSLKGSLRLFGSEPLVRLAHQIEQVVRKGHWAEAQERYPAFEQAVQELIQELGQIDLVTQPTH